MLRLTPALHATCAAADECQLLCTLDGPRSLPMRHSLRFNIKQRKKGPKRACAGRVLLTVMWVEAMDNRVYGDARPTHSSQTPRAGLPVPEQHHGCVSVRKEARNDPSDRASARPLVSKCLEIDAACTAVRTSGSHTQPWRERATKVTSPLSVRRAAGKGVRFEPDTQQAETRLSLWAHSHHAWALSAESLACCMLRTAKLCGTGLHYTTTSRRRRRRARGARLGW